ncbi:MAG: hypothetical protein DRR06_12840 [Gammaproteobacteria bacterium]|nr:MAG: hypothetical protein DRR06_12840 [Gammaproteobacteria bacterium]
MTLIASIDGPSRRVYLHADTVGASVHPIDIYKEMRTLRRTDETLRGYDLFMKSSGNESKGSGKFTERYVTLLGGTRVVPFDTSSELTITGTIITDEGTEGIACFDRTSLSPTTVVDINYFPPQVEVIEVSSGSGLSVGQDKKLSEVHGQVGRQIYVDTSSGANGNGYQQSPFNSLSDAVTEAESLGVSSLVVLDDITLTKNLKNFSITGVGLPTIDLNGQDLKGTKFYQCGLEGLFSNPIIAEECLLLNNSYLNGFFQKCAMLGNSFCIDGSKVVMEECISAIAGLGRPSISAVVSGTCELSIRGQKGGLDVRDCNQATDEITVEMLPGSVSLATSCTGGSIVVRGIGILTYTTLGSSLTDEIVHPLNALDLSSIAAAVWDYAKTSATVIGSMGEFVGNKLLTVQKYLGLK